MAKKGRRAARPQTSRPRKVALHDVAQRALRDKAFFRALNSDVERALARARLQLGARDVRTLKACLRGRRGAQASVAVRSKRVFQILHRMPKRTVEDALASWGVGWAPLRRRAR